MPKDKSKKKDKVEKTAGGSLFAAPSEAKGGGEDSWKFEDDANIGKLFLITPYREDEHDDSFNPGEKKKHIVADIVELDESKPAKSELHSESWVFGGWTRGSLRSFIGERKVLGRLQRDQSKARGKNVPWVLVDATADDIEVAKAYLDSVDPFKQ